MLQSPNFPNLRKNVVHTISPTPTSEKKVAKHVSVPTSISSDPNHVSSDLNHVSSDLNRVSSTRTPHQNSSLGTSWKGLVIAGPQLHLQLHLVGPPASTLHHLAWRAIIY